jgi:predicted metal-dependent phosphoesterase TrpH
MIDLHCHSVFSDGSCTPEELIEQAEKIGLVALSLTDHDTVAGLPRLFDAAEKTAVQVVSGVELSTELKGRTLHILGYGFDPENEALLDALKWVCRQREERNTGIFRKLTALGYQLTLADVQAQAGDKMLGRPHFAAALVEKGYFNHRSKVFSQLLKKNGAAYVGRERLSPGQCCDLIRKAGGIPVLAHPGQLGMSGTALRKLLRHLIGEGLGGLEVLYPAHQAHQVSAYERICKELGLLMTGGSDFHGSFTPQLSLGKGFGTLCVPDAFAAHFLSV